MQRPRAASLAPTADAAVDGGVVEQPAIGTRQVGACARRIKYIGSIMADWGTNSKLRDRHAWVAFLWTSEPMANVAIDSDKRQRGRRRRRRRRQQQRCQGMNGWVRWTVADSSGNDAFVLILLIVLVGIDLRINWSVAPCRSRLCTS